MTLVVTGDFGPFGGRAWLNCAHQGPLPRVAVQAAHEALAWKTAPWRLTDDVFSSIPQRLRAVLGRLVCVPAEDIILGNSTSYGLHLLANGLPWQRGDEVLLVRGDYSADILPWLALERRGVRIRFIERHGVALGPNEVEAALTPATRLFCTTWVDSFTGHAVDLEACGSLCRSRGTLFVVNASQALGARPLDLGTAPIDALTCCGFKWLCGPYGTGFCWIRPDVRATLDYNQAYWLAMQGERDLDSMRNYIVRSDSELGARKYDVFCPADFLNSMPWTAAVTYLLELGLDRIATHNEALVARLLAGLDDRRFAVVSPPDGPSQSTLVVVTHRDPERTRGIDAALQRGGVDVALREGALRISPHLYNTNADIDRALDILTSA